MAIAVYVTYAVVAHKDYAPGDVINVEGRIKGLAPAVTEYHRPEWASVVRYTLQPGESVRIETFMGCTIGEDRSAYRGGVVYREEDKDGSIKTIFRIQDEP